MPSRRDRARPVAAGRWLLVGLLAATTACSGGGPRPPAAPPPRTESPPEAAGAAAVPPPEPGPPPAVNEPRPPAPKVVIEPAEPEPGAPLTLAEAAERERRRRLRAGEPIAVITDANLDEHAVGQLTFMENEDADAAAEDAETPAAAASGADEQYWRQRVLDIRQRLAEAAKAVPTLEDKAAELRRQFYATDDGYYRDTRIKPAWDRAIDQTAQARATVDALRTGLAAALEEGRQAGALPGWLREGIDLVPPEPEPEPETYEPGEPVVVGEDSGGGTP